MNRKLLFCLIFVILLSAHGLAHAVPSIEVTQGESTVLTLKLVNVGTVSLKGVHAEIESPPVWLHPTHEPMSIYLSAKSTENAHPVARLPLSFTVDENAPVADSTPLSIKITSSSGHTWTTVIEVSVAPRPRPETFQLLQNYPNPFNPETWIPYQLNEASNVKIKIFDSAGRLVRRLALGQQSAGYYLTRGTAAYWDGKNDFGEQVTSGVYFYHLLTERASVTRKMLVTK